MLELEELDPTLREAASRTPSTSCSASWSMPSGSPTAMRSSGSAESSQS